MPLGCWNGEGIYLWGCEAGKGDGGVDGDIGYQVVQVGRDDEDRAREEVGEREDGEAEAV